MNDLLRFYPCCLRAQKMTLLLALIQLSFPISMVSAQVAEQDPAEPTVEEAMTVGSRRLNRSKMETPVPVDVLPVSEFANQAGQLDLGQLLQFTAPSFNANRQSGSDGSDHVDAATLRGLGPDQVLVLINGKRRHTSSLVYLFGSRARGNVGTDLNTIPVSAIERIEILRDGASAQYGSDAIAGVINIVLKKGKGLEAVLSAGQHREGDGDLRQVALNYGLAIGERGVLNVTGEFLGRDKTDRAPVGEPRVIGDSEADNALLFFNLDVPTGDHGTFYGHGGFNDREGLAGAWFRGGVGSGDIPSRNSAQMYPDGFVPNIGTDIADRSLAFGWRTLLGDWHLDVSSSFGSNRMDYTISDTLNASLATQNNGVSPTRFDAGGFKFTQHTTNLDLVRFFDGVADGLNLAAGLEYRREGYEIFAGEAGSYDDFDGPGNGNAGSQGFPGFQPIDEVDADRNSLAAYVDVEVQINDRWLLAAAVRAEDYSDFGNTVNGKLASTLSLSEYWTWRGSASTGFRARSLHQRFFSSTFTDFIAGRAADVKLAPNESTLANLVGIPKLKEETSTNYSMGMTWTGTTDFRLTVDAYLIDIDDRIVLTGGFSADDPDIGDIISAQQLAEARFFTNAIDTRTKGVDLTATQGFPMTSWHLNAIVALNYNETEVEEINTAPGLIGKEEIYFNLRERLFVEGSAPEVKGSLGLEANREAWKAGLKFTYFGEVIAGTWSQLDDANAPPQNYDPKWTTDLHASYTFFDQWVWSLGGTNIFDVSPTDQDPNETENGAPWENVQMGFNGTFWYTRVGFSF